MTVAAAMPRVHERVRDRISRMSTTGQVVGSFAAVFVVYWLYWLIAVPVIEPGVDPRKTSKASDDDVRQAREATSARKQALAAYFPPGSWELDNPAIWETDQTLLLFKTPRPLPDGQVELRYCTLLFFPRSREAADGGQPRPIIMRAPEGATLKFDQPIEMKNVDLSKRELIGGHLRGKITISREPSRPGAADDLLITTRDVELAGDRAFSPHPVDFRFGRSYGSGRDLEILLASEGNRPGGAFRSGKVRALLLKRDVVAYLALDGGAFGGAPQPKQSDAPEAPMKITCQGAFQYDFVHSAASFHDRVDVVRPLLGQSDLLNCEVLSVYFPERGAGPPAETPPAPAANTAAGTSGGNQLSGLAVRKLEARGEPVTLVSPARGIYIQCRGLDYYPAPAGAIGRLVGIGPGVMQGSVANNPASKYRIQWTREFGFEPAEGGQYVASLQGGAAVRMASMGEITANDRLDADGTVIEEGRLFTWLTPIKAPEKPETLVQPVSMQTASKTPGTPPAPAGAAPGAPTDEKWQLERVLAQGNVRVNVPQLDGATEKLEVWVERQPLSAGPVQPGEPAAAPADPPAPARKPRPTQQQKSTDRYAVRSGGIQVKLVPDGQEFAPTNITLDNQAHLEELTPRPGEKPLVVDGDRLHVADANSPQTRVTVVGKPAHVEAGGIVLFGETIELEKSSNRLWVDGSGKMILPMTQDLDGRPLARPESMEIVWLANMHFQGDTVAFQRDVRVTSQQQLLTTQKLEATLTRPIDFAKGMSGGGGKDAPQLAQIRCYGESYLHSREYDARGLQTSISQMKLIDLALDRTTGAVVASGPGWVKRVARETNDRPRPGLPGQPRAKPLGMTYLHVDYQRSITGNLNHREMTFGEPTKTVYAPVADWNATLNADEPASLGPEGMVMDAKQLTVREMPARDKRERGSFELVATGNVLVEGSQFAALGHRATYSQDKDQLVLEGDGRSPAEISYANPRGGGRQQAKTNKITYSISLQHVFLSGAQGMEFDMPQNRPPQAKPTSAK